ncbi:MAG: LexA family transcriptional regulator [Pseudomonadota bacterium]
MSLADRIVKVRESLGLTQAEFAKAIAPYTSNGKCSRGTVAMWETGANVPSRDNRKAIAAAGNVSMQYLLFGEPLPEEGALGSFSKVVGGRVVPVLSLTEITEERPFSSRTSVRTVFPCGPNSFQIVVADEANAPTYQPGDRLVFDPDGEQRPGVMVVALVGEGRAVRPIIGELRQRLAGQETATLIHPQNDAYAEIISTLEAIEIVGVLTEVTRRAGP